MQSKDMKLIGLGRFYDTFNEHNDITNKSRYSKSPYSSHITLYNKCKVKNFTLKLIAHLELLMNCLSKCQCLMSNSLKTNSNKCFTNSSI
jgi:hypothetical protein